MLFEFVEFLQKNRNIKNLSVFLLLGEKRNTILTFVPLTRKKFLGHCRNEHFLKNQLQIFLQVFFI